MTKSKHVVVLCHPNTHSFNAAVAGRYCQVVEEEGQTAILRDLYRMKFDPVLQNLERPGSADFLQSPHIAHELDVIAAAQVLVFVYPIWFGTPPAMLKGYVDRVLGSGFTAADVRSHEPRSPLAGAHLLSLTSSASSQIWLDEQGQWQSLVTVFDHYIQHAFAMASSRHSHFSPIDDDLSARSFAQHMVEVADAARTMCALVRTD